MESLFGRYEAAALLAVERANGGELAPLDQVIVAFEGLFGQSVTATTFAESLSLLIDAGLVNWAAPRLELTVDGRRMIRRSGSHWDPDFPDKVAERLSRIGEDELAPEGELPAPTEADVLSALGSLKRGRLEGWAPVTGDAVAPSGMAGHQTIGARLLSGLPTGYGVRVAVPGMTAAPASDTGQQLPSVPSVPSVPLVAPADAAGEDADTEQDDEAEE